MRCAVSRAVLSSESAQSRCNGVQTAIGTFAYKKANDAVRNLFGENKIISHLDYVEAVDGLSENDDESAKSARKAAYVNSSPTVAAAAITSVKPFCQ